MTSRERRATVAFFTFVVVALLVLGGLQLQAIDENSERISDVSRVSARADRLSQRIQSQRVDNIRAACGRDNDQNAAIRGFIVNSLPATLRQPREVRDYLNGPEWRGIVQPIRAAPAATNPRPVPAAFVIAYLRRTAKTFPNQDCERRVRDQAGTR